MEVRSLQKILTCGAASFAGILFCCAAGPTTAPADPHITALIQQLGDDDPAVRKDAITQLRAAGPDAKAELQASADDSDPEIRAQVHELLSPPQLPTEAPPGVAFNGPFLRFSSNMSGPNMIKEVSMRGRTTHIEQGPDGIKMTVTGYVEGQQVTQHYNAHDPVALKEQFPDAYNLWAQLGGSGSAMTIGPNQVVNGGILIMPQPIGAPDDDIARLGADLDGQMQKSKLTDAQKEQIRQQVRLIEVNQAAEAEAVPPAREKRQADYLTACDDLRKLLAAAGLPDPGTVLPPPASQRLGVTVSAGGQLAGVAVAEIQPDSRASKLGLQPNDVIMVMNGKRVTNTQDLRRLVMANKQLDLLVIRNGQEMKLTESAANNPASSKSDTPDKPAPVPSPTAPQ